MRYALCFFPGIGMAVAACMYLLWMLPAWVGFYLPSSVRVLIGTALPILLTGGIHMDGFLDTMDALHSYQPKERKLEILKDPHIGAFAAICLACELLLYGAALFLLLSENQVLFLGIGFCLSRTLSAASLLTVKSAKREGLLYTFASSAQKRLVLIVLLGWLFLEATFAAYLYGGMGVICIAVSLLVFFYYEWMAVKQFGGLTGDLAGWFVVVYEMVFAWIAGVMGYLWS